MRLGLIAVALVVSACGGSSTGPAGNSSPAPSEPSSPAAVPAQPPVVSENFTVLPCSPGTTIGMEGCAEHRILRADRVINRELRRLWLQAATDAAREHLVEAQTSWQDYRTAACTSEADAYTGGSLAPVAAAQCSLRLTRRRAVELRRQIRLLGSG